MPTVHDATVINQPYSTEGNGGRKLVMLDNGWLVAGVKDNPNRKIFFYVFKGVEWEELCYFYHSGLDTSDIAMVSKGTRVIVVNTHSSSVNCHSFDVTNVPNDNIYSTSPYNSSLITSLKEIGRISLAINREGTELHATWASKNNIYPNSFNLQYVKGLINTDGSITWGSVEQVSKYTISGWYMQNPSVIVNDNAEPLILGESYDGNKRRIYIFKRDGLDSSSYYNWSYKYVYTASGSHKQYGPSAIYVSPEISGTPNGRIWVVWYGYGDTHTSHVQIFVSYSDDGGVNWTSTERLNNTLNLTQAGPSLTANNKNEVFITWFGYDSRVSTQSYNIKQVKWSEGTFEEIEVITNSTNGNYTNPSTLFDPTFQLDFPEPLFIYEAITRVGFYGTWSLIEISVPQQDLKEKDNPSSFLTYNVTGIDGSVPIVEKVNGQVIRTINNPIDAQDYTVNIPQNMWDNLKFGKYRDTNEGRNELTIEVGDVKWTYPFTKILPQNASIIESTKALKDLKDYKIPNESARRVINFYVNPNEPTPQNVGDVWVKTSETLRTDNVILAENEPSGAEDKQIWQKVSGIDYTLDLQDVSAFFSRSDGELHIEIDSKSILPSIPEDKVLIWKNKYQKAFGDLSSVQYWDSATSEWKRVEAFCWNGSRWEQISTLIMVLYDSGTQLIPFETSASSNRDPAYFNTDYIQLETHSNECIVRTVNGLDVTDVEFVYFDVEEQDTNYKKYVYVGPNEVSTDRQIGRKTYQVDVRGLSGLHVIGAGVKWMTGQPSGWRRMKVYKIWAE